MSADAVSLGAVAVAMRTYTGRSPTAELRSPPLSATARAAINACSGVVAVTVVSVDWRGAVLLGAVMAVLFLGHRSHVSLAQRHEALRRLKDFTGSIPGGVGVDEAAQLVVEQSREQLQAEVAQILLVDDAGERWWHAGGDPPRTSRHRAYA